MVLALLAAFATGFAAYTHSEGEMQTAAYLKLLAVLESRKLPLDAEGVLLFHAPLDYLVWTEYLASIFAAVNDAASSLPEVKGKELWLAGNLSPLARRNIEAAGWKVFDNQEVRLLGETEGAKERISYN